MGNADSLEKANNEYNNTLNRYDARNLFDLKRTVIDSNSSDMRKFFDNLEYIIFGFYANYQMIIIANYQ